MKDAFIVPIFLYGIEYVLIVMALCAVAAGICTWRRRFMLAGLCFVLLLGAVASVPVYRDTVLRAQDADAQVVRLLWGRAYPGVFRMTADGEPGLPPFVGAVKARAWEFLPGTADWMKFSDACLKRVEGRNADKRRFDMMVLADNENPRCASFESIRASFDVDIPALLHAEYEILRAYAARVEKADGSAQQNCPPFFSDIGRYQKQELNRHTGMMERVYDLSGIKCACVALGRYKGCRALDARDRAEGYPADFRAYDFFTPLTCDQSELCTVMRAYVTLENAAPDVPKAEKESLIARGVERCVASEQFSAERRADLCGCSVDMLAGQDPRVERLSRAAAQCLADRGFLDEENCVIGEADWSAQREAVRLCIMDGG